MHFTCFINKGPNLKYFQKKAENTQGVIIIIIIIIIKERAELETTRKKALSVGGLIHAHTD